MSRWWRATAGVLTALATILQISSWLWPTSRDWIQTHGLLLLASNILLCILLSAVLWRDAPAPQQLPDPQAVSGGLVPSDRALLDKLLEELPPEQYESGREPPPREEVDRLMDAYYFTSDPRRKFKNDALQRVLEAILQSLAEWTQPYVSAGVSPERDQLVRKTARNCVHQNYASLWDTARTLGY